ncbi:Holliday junction resolvase RuvX [bacterium]|nr:Holliday junction resolvase RuvX [bacterium]
MIENIFKSLKEKYSNTNKRFLGVDFGTVNIGLAVSDVSRSIASPYKMLKNKSYSILFNEFEEIIKEMDIAVIVIGLPLQMNGIEGDTAIKVNNFKEELEKHFSNIDIVLFDERLTSAISEKMLIREFDLSRQKRKKILDKVSASYILQNALDKMNF